MKELTLKHSLFSSTQLLDENEKLLGELMPNLVAGFKEKIKIENQIFKIKYNSLFSRNFKIFCNNEILIVKSDIYRNRFVFFGNDIEVFTYKSYGWFSNKLDFYEKNKLIVSIESKRIFKTKYKISIDENFSNYLLVLAIINFYLNGRSS